MIFWRNSSGGIADMVRVEINPDCPWPELQGLEVIVSRPDGGDFLYGVRRLLPRGGGSDFLLACTECHRPRRYLYAWSNWMGRVMRVRWPCRRCAALRYASEGVYDPWRAAHGSYQRPDTWNPYVMTLRNAAEEMGGALQIVGAAKELRRA
jgi:hypothetical protein